MQPLKAPRISGARLLEAVTAYLPEAIATSLLDISECVRVNAEMVIVLSRTDPGRILIKLREEKVIVNHFVPVRTKGERQRNRSAYDADRVESFSNNALTKIDREVIEPLLSAFYSDQKMTTIDAMIRFRSGVVSSITLKTEINGY
jgi:hypothetical protein